MSESSSAELEYLRRQLADRDAEIRKLTGENTRRKESRRSLEQQLSARITELEEALAERDSQLEEIATEVEAASTEWEEQLTALTAERDEALQKAEAAPEDFKQELESLRQEKIATAHKEAFKELYGDPDVNLDDKLPVDQLWKMMDYKAEGTPDKATIKAALAEKLKALDFLPRRAKDDAPPEAPAADPSASDELPPPGRPGAGIARGSAAAGGAGKFSVTWEQLGDPKWMYENQERIDEAKKEGNFEIVNA